jgi:hypothetical protein
MRKSIFLLSSDAQAGTPPAAATPPQAAEVVANGKSEREATLEKENAALKNAVKKTADSKRKVELDNIRLASENQSLKQIPQPAKPAAAAKSSWGFFSN